MSILNLESWVNEGLAILNENLIAGQCIHHDCKNNPCDLGDITFVRRPQDKIDVPTILDQWFYTSFIITDDNACLAFQNLVDIYLRPGMVALARELDQVIIGRMNTVLPNRVGRLHNLPAEKVGSYLTVINERFKAAKVPVFDRSILIGPGSENAILQSGLMMLPENRPNTSLGYFGNFDIFLHQQINSIRITDCDIVTGLVQSGYETGYSGHIAVDRLPVIQTGEFVTIAGDDQPTYAITVIVKDNATKALRLSAPLKYPVGTAAVVTVYKAGTVEGNYPAGWTQPIILDDCTLKVGRLVAFHLGLVRHTYTVIETHNNSVLLDRALELPVIDHASCFPGPAGTMNLAFHRNAVALVTRPIRTRWNENVACHRATLNDITMRCSMKREERSTIVTLDILAGISLLDENYGIVLLG